MLTQAGHPSLDKNLSRFKFQAQSRSWNNWWLLARTGRNCFVTEVVLCLYGLPGDLLAVFVWRFCDVEILWIVLSFCLPLMEVCAPARITSNLTRWLNGFKFPIKQAALDRTLWSTQRKSAWRERLNDTTKAKIRSLLNTMRPKRVLSYEQSTAHLLAVMSPAAWRKAVELLQYFSEVDCQHWEI